MYKITLPEFIRGNYSISNENDKKLINIEAINGKWQVNKNKNFKIIAPKEIKNIKNYRIMNDYKVKSLDNIETYIYEFKELILEKNSYLNPNNLFKN